MEKISFEDKYSTTDDKKILISNDAYAIGEMIEKLLNEIKRKQW